jgi:hypothetical protein
VQVCLHPEILSFRWVNAVALSNISRVPVTRIVGGKPDILSKNAIDSV